MGSVLWVGSDRGYIESFRLVDAKGISGRVAKGCRVQADPKRHIVALSYRLLIAVLNVDGQIIKISGRILQTQ